MDVKEKVQHKEESEMGQNIFGPCCCEFDACTASASCGTASVCVCVRLNLFFYTSWIEAVSCLFQQRLCLGLVRACACACVCGWTCVCLLFQKVPNLAA